MKRAASVEDHKLNSAYEIVRKALAASKYSQRKEKPLAFWALPNDRRLPMALLGHPLKEILSQPLDELAATPGIGKKKLHVLIKLLHRATKDEPPAPLLFPEEAPKKRTAKVKTARQTATSTDFDPNVVSELLWEQWCDTVRRHGLEQHWLGRLAPSLDRLPTVIWRTPLADYLELTLAEIRALKTHGEKRLRSILEVFHSVHQTLGAVPNTGHLRVDLGPKFTVPIERWSNDAIQRSGPPTLAELRQHVILPLLEQLHIDAGPEIARILDERLGVKGPPVPVQKQSKRIGVTRARVYQLLETCAEVMAVRWPSGEELFRRLLQKLRAFSSAKSQLERLRALTDVIYPALRQSADASPSSTATSTGEAGGATKAERDSGSSGSRREHRRSKNGSPARVSGGRR